MIEKDTEALLEKVVDWFKYGGWTGPMYEPQVNEFDQLVRTLCSGDPANVDKLVNKSSAGSGGFLTVAADHLNNQYGGVREIVHDGLFHDWTGHSADDFHEYISSMSNALDDCQAIADGVRAIMSAFQAVAQKAHDDARTLLKTVSDKQDALQLQILQFTLTTVGVVAGSLSGFTAIAATMAAKDLLDTMKAAVDVAGYAVSSTAQISGLTGNDILFSALDNARLLQKAVGAEIDRLNAMIKSVNTQLQSAELTVSKPEVVTDEKFKEKDFYDGDDPNKITDESALV